MVDHPTWHDTTAPMPVHQTARSVDGQCRLTRALGAVRLVRHANALGLKPGVADADKQYFADALAERLLIPTLDAGFTPSTDYRADRLGVNGGAHGALFVEGVVYCPSTPPALREDLSVGRIRMDASEAAVFVHLDVGVSNHERIREVDPSMAQDRFERQAGHFTAPRRLAL